MIAINLYGVLHTSKAVLPIMAAQGHGHVVNLGSDAGRVGSSGEAVYSAAKGGVIAFTKADRPGDGPAPGQRQLRLPRPDRHRRCSPPSAATTRSCGRRLTKAIPFRRLADPSDLANAVAFFASDEAAYITGQTVSVSGGLTMS